MTSTRGRFAVAIVLMGSMVLATTSASIAQSPELAPDLVRVLEDPQLLEAAIDADMDFRERLGYRHDRAYVEDLYAHPGKTVGHRVYLALLTEGELKDFEERMDLERDADWITAYYAERPGRSDEFGGLYLDQRAGGVLVVRLAAGADRPWMDEMRYPRRIGVRRADVSLATLQSVFGEVRKASEEDPRITGYWIDIASGEVAVGLTTKAMPDSGATPDWIRERFGAHVRAEAYESRDEATATIIAAHGYKLTAGGSTTFCSFGFRTDKTPGKWSLTAGHCINDRLHASHQGDPIFTMGGNAAGNLRAFQFQHLEVGDYGRIEVDDADTVPGKVVHLGYRLAVTGQSSGCTSGALRYMTGEVGGTTWGDISSCTYDSKYEDDANPGYLVKVLNMVKYDVYTGSAANGNGKWPQHGDSGGPVYTVNASTGTVTAYGVQGSRGRTFPDDPPNANTVWYGAYTKISQVASDYGDPLTNTDTCSFTPPTCPTD